RGGSGCPILRQEKQLCRLSSYFCRSDTKVNRFGCWFRLKRRAVVSQHCFANNLQWHPALLHELVVKLHQAKIATAHFTIILAQFENLQLAQRIHEIGWVRGTALGFHIGHSWSLVAFLYEELSCLIERHISGMQLDADNVTCV